MHLTSSATASDEIRLSTTDLAALVLTENELCDRFADASPGDALVYHIGRLAADRDVMASKLAATQRAELDRLARRVWRMHEEALVHLVQRRIAPESVAYLAVIRPRPRRAAQQVAA
jgi:hypothetical protein